MIPFKLVLVLVEPVQAVFCAYPQVAFCIFRHAIDDIATDTVRIVGMVPVNLKGISVEFIESVACTKPYIS